MADVHFRSKRVCMSLTDWGGFAAEVAKANPGTSYCRSTSEKLYFQKEPPNLPVSDEFVSFLQDEDDIPYEIDMIRDSDLRLSWNRPVSRWNQRYSSRLLVKFHPGGRVIEDDPRAPPHIRSGEIIVYCSPGKKDDLAFAQRLFRLMRKFTTNTNQACYSYPQYEVRWTQDKGNLNWLGHDAIRWAREDKRRMLCYQRSGSSDNCDGWGLRPNDEGIVKPWRG